MTDRVTVDIKRNTFEFPTCILLLMFLFYSSSQCTARYIENIIRQRKSFNCFYCKKSEKRRKMYDKVLNYVTTTFVH